MNWQLGVTGWLTVWFAGGWIDSIEIGFNLERSGLIGDEFVDDTPVFWM